jgi:hypothetical protein
MIICVKQVKNVFQNHGYVMDQSIVVLEMIPMKDPIAVCILSISGLRMERDGTIRTVKRCF